MQTVDPGITLGRVDFTYRFENEKFWKREDSCEFQTSLFGGDWRLTKNQNLWATFVVGPCHVNDSDIHR